MHTPSRPIATAILAVISQLLPLGRAARVTNLLLLTMPRVPGPALFDHVRRALEHSAAAEWQPRPARIIASPQRVRLVAARVLKAALERPERSSMDLWAALIVAGVPVHEASAVTSERPATQAVAS